MYLETGATPLSFIILNRRINYLHTILTRDDNELIKRVYKTQKSNPSSGDFVKLVESDLETIGEEFDENLIRSMDKEKFKVHVRTKVKEVALSHLKTLQAGHSKIKCIEYTQLATQPYLKSSSFTNKECELLFALRSKSVRGIKAKTPSVYRNNMICPLSCDKTNPQDEQEHLLKCHIILQELNTQ